MGWGWGKGLGFACGEEPGRWGMETWGGIGRFRRYGRAWQMAAYWARFLTHTSMAKSEGMPFSGSIWRTFLHLAKRAPCAYAW